MNKLARTTISIVSWHDGMFKNRNFDSDFDDELANLKFDTIHQLLHIQTRSPYQFHATSLTGGE